MLPNTFASMAMAQAQEQQQQQDFARQNAANNYGADHLGNQVNRDQRSAWNDRLSKFRAENGPVTSQQYFNYADASPSDQEGMMAAYNNPMDYGIDGAGMRGSGMGGRGMAAFKGLGNRALNSRYGATNMGRAMNGMLGRPQATGYDMTDGWNESMDQGGMGAVGPGGEIDNEGNDTGSRGFY